MREVVDNRYRIIKSIGSGGMGKVYLAHDEILDRDVAIKILTRQHAEHPEFVERFKREARSAASLSHPNIVTIHDWGKTEDGTYYIAMEYVPGSTLKEYVLREGLLPPSAAIGVTLQVAKALEVAHRKGIIHRDVKPQNILATHAGDIKVTDFGIARAASLTTLTQTGFILGTAHYISPEQAMGNPVGPQSDLYSLGVVFYEMLTGEVPYDADTPIAIAMKHVNGRLIPPKEVTPGIPEGVNTLTIKLLAKDPEERPTNAATLIEDLKRIEEDLPKEATTRTLKLPIVVDGGGKTCNQCGNFVQEEDSFCGVCGARVVPAPRDTTSTRQMAEPSYVPPSPYAPSRSGDRRKLTWAIAIGVGLILLVGGGVAYAALGSGISLLAGSEPQTEDNGSSAQSPSNQINTTTSKEATEGTTSPSSKDSSLPNKSEDRPSGTQQTGAGDGGPTQSAPAPSATASEAEAEQAAGDYYRKAGLKDWDYTYNHLDSQTRRLFTKEEWSQKNQWFADNSPAIYHINSVDLENTSREPIAQVAVRLTGEDGSTSIRNTYFVLENGEWKHRFAQEEKDLFMPGTSFEEFVKAQKSSTAGNRP